MGFRHQQPPGHLQQVTNHPLCPPQTSNEQGVCTPPLHPKPSLLLTAGEHQGKLQSSILAMSLSNTDLPRGTSGIVCLSLPPSFLPCTPIHPPIYLSICPPSNPSIYPPLYLSICPPSNLSTHPSIHLSISSSIHVRLSIHQSGSELYAAKCCFLLPSSEQISQGNRVSPWTCTGTSCSQKLNPRSRGQKVKAVIWGPVH